MGLGIGFLKWRRKEVDDYEPTGNEQAWSGKLDSQYEDVEYPLYLETFHADSENTTIRGMSGVGSIKDMIDYEVGGVPGMSKYVGSTGVVEPSFVDAHNFDGSQTIVRRMSPNMNGPVGGQEQDHNALLALLYVQAETSTYFPNEVSQADLIKGV